MTGADAVALDERGYARGDDLRPEHSRGKAQGEDGRDTEQYAEHLGAADTAMQPLRILDAEDHELATGNDEKGPCERPQRCAGDEEHDVGCPKSGRDDPCQPESRHPT